MANESNLQPVRTESEARELGQRGGIASGKARREKRDRHKRIQDLFALAIKDPKLKDNLAKMGIDVTDADLETAADARVMVELLKRGDYKAWQAMKQEAYPENHQIEIADGVKSITINIKRYDGGDE